MEDLIASLYPYEEDQNARAAVRLPDNDSRRVEPRDRPPELSGRQSRETTAPPDDEDCKKNADPRDIDYGLELRFSHGPKGGQGFVLGTDASSCDIVLPPLKIAQNGPRSISRRHCCITFDEERRLIVQDTSSRGTTVTYNDEGKQKRRNFTWIIGGHEIPDGRDKIIIEIAELQFQVFVTKHRLNQGQFFNNVDQFRDNVIVNNELPFGALGINSALATAAASGRDTPDRSGIHSKDVILLKQGKLGEGTFSVVSRVWDVSTGMEYASKKFRKPEGFNWRKEADVMREISHEHIIKLYFALEEPSPRLMLEYLPLGNLENQHRQQRISEVEVLTLLRQSSAALSYLHGQKEPIVHRDIKPENILVLSRSPFHIKLADFGLAKASIYLKTLCGTLLYIAPEIAQYYEQDPTRALKYTRAVDIWSLGVVVFEYTCGLPDCTKLGLPWCKKIVKRLHDKGSDGLLNILSGMLVIEPKRRDSAEICLRKASELEGPQTPKQAPCESRVCQLEELGPTILDYTAAAFHDLQQDDPRIRSSVIKRYIRSNLSHQPGVLGFKSNELHEDRLDSIRDSEIQGYIRTQIHHDAGAPSLAEALHDEDSSPSTGDAGSQIHIRSQCYPATVDKRKRSTQRSATSSSSARRTKRTVVASPWNWMQHEDARFAQDQHNDPRYTGYGEQDEVPWWDALASNIDGQGRVNVRQSPEIAGYGDAVIERDEQKIKGDADQDHGHSAPSVWTESFIATLLRADLQ